MTLNYGGKPAVPAMIAADSDGNKYSGTDATLQALTAADIAGLQSNYPHQHGLTQDQYDVWLASAYFLRHVNDDIGIDPWL